MSEKNSKFGILSLIVIIICAFMGVGLVHASIPNGSWIGDWFVEKNGNFTVSIKSPLGIFDNVTSPIFVNYILGLVDEGMVDIEDKIDIIDGIVDDILLDTNELQLEWVDGGRLDLLIDSILADTNELQAEFVDGGRLDLLIDSILADTNELQAEFVDGGRLDLLIDSTLADTNELQTDWTNGGRLDLLIDAIKAKTDTIVAGGDATIANQNLILADIGDASASTLGSIYAILGNPTTTITSRIDTILADTNELQTDWVNGGRLDLLIDAIKAKTDNVGLQPLVTASDTVLLANDAEATVQQTAYTKIKESRIFISGTYRIYWDYHSQGAYNTYTKLYINGVAYGTEYFTQSVPYITVASQDVILEYGDYIQVYGKQATPHIIYVCNLKICGTVGTGVGVNIS